MLRFFRFYGLSCVVGITIFYLCIARTLPVDDVPKFEGIDKVVHFLMYLGFAAALCMDHYRLNVPFNSKRMIFMAIVFPVIYGGLIEILQENFFPPRSGEWADFLADSLGAVAGYFLAKALLPRFVKKW
ncbi:MAG: VanZ family protein [Paludibacteraceae bacterium]|nr:VanZ family protein [Paludibacteraceae bacterium]